MATRAPNAIEVEWALLRLSQLYSDDVEGQVTDYVLIGTQDRRLEEIEKRLDQVGDSLEMKFFNQLQACIRWFPFDATLHVCTPFTRRYGPAMKRPKVANDRRAGFEVQSVTPHYLDGVKSIEARKPVG